MVKRASSRLGEGPTAIEAEGFCSAPHLVQENDEGGQKRKESLECEREPSSMAAQLRRLPVAEVVHLSNGRIGFHPVFFLIGFLPILKLHLPVCLKVFNVPPGLDSQGSRSRPNYGNPRKSKFSKERKCFLT